MKTSVIVTTRNRKKELLACLDSIIKSQCRDFEIIVIDDCSSDGTEKLKKVDFHFKNIRLIHSLKHLMMVDARNLGAKKARGKYIVFVDDDNVLTKKALAKIIESADKHPKYGIIGAPIYFLTDKKKYFSGQKFNFFTGQTETLIRTRKKFIDSDGTPNFFLVKKEVFGQCGYFDPSLFQTFTEPDFSFKALKAGFRTGICQKVITYHDIKDQKKRTLKSLGNIYYQTSYCLTRNRTVLVARYGKLYHKIIYLLFFSWTWPLFYSLMALKYRQIKLIPLYWAGFKDGLLFLFTGNLSLEYPKLIKS